jgi:tetratricopeptide (TPR) repeat protein
VETQSVRVTIAATLIGAVQLASSAIGAAYRSSVALLFGLALGCVLVRAQEQPSDFDDLAAKAAAARDAGDADNAVRYYQAALQLRPHWEEGSWYLGTLLYDSDRFGDAVAPFQQVIELDPKLGPAWAFLGLCEFELGQYPQSLEDLQRARALGFDENPELNKVALYHLALLLNASGQFESCKELLFSEFSSTHVPDQILVSMGMALLRIPLLSSRLDPSKDALVHAAGETAALLAAGNLEGVRDHLLRLLQDYPGTPYLHYAFGNALLASGRPQEAEEQFREEMRISPKSALPLVALSAAALERNRPNDALLAAKQAKDLAPGDPAVHRALAEAYAALGQRESAEAERAQQAALADQSHVIEADQVTRYSLRSDTAVSASPVVATSAGAEQEFESVVRQGEAAQQAGRLDEATKAYQTALRLHPDWGDAWRSLGTIAYMQSRYPDAVAALQKAVIAEPKQADAWTLLGLSEFECKDYKNARLHLERGGSLGFGGNAAAVKFAKYRLALLLNLDGDFDRATDLLIPEVGSGALASEIRIAMGLALLRIPLLPDQISREQRVLVTQAGEVAGLLSQRHYDQAFPIFDAMLREYPDTPFLHYAYGASLANISEFDRAQVQLREEIRLNPQSPLPYLRLASILLTLHQPESAVGFAKQALAPAPSSPEAHYLLGRGELELGDSQSAIRELEAASRLAPGSPAVHFNLARAYSKAQRPGDAERERAQFERLNQRMTSQDPSQPSARGISQSTQGVAEGLSVSPR